MSIAALQRATREVNKALAPLEFDAPVAYVYNPLVYAKRSHGQYIERFGQGPKDALLLGMNPGPFGMAQTGVPFGEVALVREWLGIEAKVEKPPVECPKRPITGFDCTRSEVSGRRLWGWARERYGTPKKFFDKFYIHNYCPLVFMEEGGRNVTPDKLKATSRDELFAICDRYMKAVVRAVQPRMIIGVGAFAEQRARKTFDGTTDFEFGRIPHPSPASPAANKGWDALADKAFAELGF